MNLPTEYLTTDGFRLGGWVSEQRKRKNLLSLERITRLEALPGWVWDVLAEQWELGFRHLIEFANREGHCKVHKGHKTTDGYRLATWVNTQRIRIDVMSIERKARLEAIPGWAWRIKG